MVADLEVEVAADLAVIVKIKSQKADLLVHLARNQHLVQGQDPGQGHRTRKMVMKTGTGQMMIRLKSLCLCIHPHSP